MFCESCKVVVKEALDELDIPSVKVELGEIETRIMFTIQTKSQLLNSLCC